MTGTDYIIGSLPWNCGEESCGTRWHVSQYWSYADGTFSVDNYTDGDHDTIDQDELPTEAEMLEAWREYARDVVRTGRDPLNDYSVPRARKVAERWEIRMRFGIVPVFEAARRGQRVYTEPQDLPDYVREYLCLRTTGNLRVVEASAADLKEAGVRFGVWHVVRIERSILYSPERVARELRRMARKGLKRVGKKRAA